MGETRLATFVHISDLHFGNVDYTGRQATLDADAEAWWRKHPIFDGYLEHSYDAWKHFPHCFINFRAKENASLIITGDLTAVGSASQFRLAEEFLAARINLDPGNPLGLDQ